MNAFEECVIASFKLPGFQSVNPAELIGPDHRVGCDIPLEAADVSHPLSLGQHRFASSQTFLRGSLLGNVEGCADATGNMPGIIRELLDENLVPAPLKLVF